MLTCILNTLRFYLAVLSQAALLLCAGATQASTVHLAPGLEIVLPDSLAIQVISPHDQFSSPVIAGELSGEPGYFIAAVKIKTWEKNGVLWKRLESEIRRLSSAGEFTITQQGNFFTALNHNVWFRAYQYQTQERSHHQVYFLLKDQRITYWVTVTMVEGADINLSIPIAKALIRRARIINQD